MDKANMGDVMDIPENMTEEEVLNIVRELLGDDNMTDHDLRAAYRSGMFQELCPDIVQYATGKNPSSGNKDNPKKTSTEKSTNDQRPATSKSKDEGKVESNSKFTKSKDDADSESESVVSAKHSHHKKKKKKHSKDHKRDKEYKRERDKEERKDKQKSVDNKEVKKSKSETHRDVVMELSDSEDERRKKEVVQMKEKKKRVIPVSSSSDSDSDKKRNKHRKEQITKSNDNKNDRAQAKEKTETEQKPKVHPFYVEKGNNPGVSQPSAKSHQEPKREKTPEKKVPVPEPPSNYDSSVSKVKLKKWRPFLPKEHLRHQRKFRLIPTSVVCVDLMDLPMVFHPPNKHSKNPNAVPLSKKFTVTLSNTRLEMIRRLERDKANWFRKKINKKALRFLRRSKNKRLSDSSDDDRKPKRMRIMITSSSNSDTSSIMVPKNKDHGKPQAGGKLSKAQREAEAKRRKFEEMKKKVEKFSNRGTRVLPWENKDAYFKNKKKDDPAKGREKMIAEKKKRQEELRKQKLEQQKNAPSVSFQRILKQIETANKEQASKPKVELKIPKKNQNSSGPVHIFEYKLDGKVGVGDVYKEVTKLLSANVLVECPVMAGPGDDLGEYTVKKIAWWLLKNEKDPPEIGVYHPECHDDDDAESVHSDDFDWPSDVSSINGCVSDPEGVGADIPPDPKKVADPDWADDYCGEASLYAKIRKVKTGDAQNDLEDLENFRKFLRMKPGTNYSKNNFEVKCFVCNELLNGQRQFGAHVRSDSHKNNFRNYSLDMANYEEKTRMPEPKKYFVAKLIEYSLDPSTGKSTTTKSNVSVETKHEVGKVEHARSDSPGPIVGGDAAPNIMVQEMPIPDDISFASFQNYDISSDESLQNVRVAIRTKEKWDNELERRWRTWKDEEAKIAEEYNGEREFFIDEPQKHPSYQEEWMKFWDEKCAELEAQGIDTENYNFHKDWMAVWLKRMQEIMRDKVEKRVAELKRSLLIDKHTLRDKYNICPIETKRQKVKKNGKKTNLQNDYTSSVKTLDKMVPSAPYAQPSVPAALQQRNPNNVQSKPECLPTPPVTDEERNRETGASGDSRSQKRESKSGPRSKHDERSKHREDSRYKEKHKDKYQDDKHRRNKDRKYSSKDNDYHRDRDEKRRHHDVDKYDKNDKRHKGDKHDKTDTRHKDEKYNDKDDTRRRDEKYNAKNDTRRKDEKYNDREGAGHKSKQDNFVDEISPLSTANLDSPTCKNITKSISSISSAEPPPPGEKPTLNRDRKPGRPAPPVISDRASSQIKELNQRIETKLKAKLEPRRKSDDRKPEAISKDSKLTENSTTIHSNSNEPPRSKNVSSWSLNSSDNEEEEGKRNESGSSTASNNSNARTLQDRLKALREALAHDDSMTNRPISERPKVIPLEVTKNKTNLEDGEVGSDISDLDLNARKGVSTFVNKEIPGLADLDKKPSSSSISANNLDKNSIGYHLLERKKSIEESGSNHNEKSNYMKRDDNKSNQKDDKHGNSKDHSPGNRHNNKNDHGGSTDDRRRWDNAKDNRNYDNKEHQGHKKKKSRNRRNKQRNNNNPPPFVNNQNNFTNNVAPFPHDESWEPVEASWEPTPLFAQQIPPPLYPPVPDTSHIPVLNSSRQPNQPYQQYQQPNPWASSGWGNQGYPPQTDYNNYYR